MYKFLQPQLDDLLFLGKDYERYFDEFEIMFTLLYVDLQLQENQMHIFGYLSEDFVGNIGIDHRAPFWKF